MPKRNDDRLRALVPASIPATPTEEAKDSLGRKHRDLADAMTSEEAAMWLDLVILDGYRTSVHVAMRKVLKMLREQSALSVVQDEAPKAASGHIDDDCEVVRGVGWMCTCRTPREKAEDAAEREACEQERDAAALGASRPSPVDQSTLDRIDASLRGVNGLPPHITVDDGLYLLALARQAAPAERQEEQ